MKPDEIRRMTPEQRREYLEKLRRELMILESKRRRGTLKNTAKLKLIRKEIARVLTIMREFGEIL